MDNIPKKITDELLFSFDSLYSRTNRKKIAERYNFLDKLDVFSELVRRTLYGEQPVASLRESLERELGVSEEVANYIAIELDQDLFSDVRDEFNVAQGLMTVEEYMKEYPDEGVDDEEMSTEASSAPAQPKPAASDPVAASILGDNRRPGAQPDPYREPIDEE